MESTNYMTFYENWVDIMEMCTAEEWYELSKMITNLRFKKIDTDVKTISNIKIKMAWVAIRPSILKSNRNTRHNNKKKQSQGVENNSTNITPNTEFEEPQTIEDMGNYTGIQFKQQEEIETQDYKDETTIANEFITNNGKDAYDIYYELNVLKYNEQKDTERYEELKMLWDELWTPYRVYDEETFELIKSKVAERYNKRVIKQFILENEYKQILTV